MRPPERPDGRSGTAGVQLTVADQLDRQRAHVAAVGGKYGRAFAAERAAALNAHAEHVEGGGACLWPDCPLHKSDGRVNTFKRPLVHPAMPEHKTRRGTAKPRTSKTTSTPSKKKRRQSNGGNGHDGTTREQWLNQLAEAMRPMFAAVDAPLPPRFRITMSLTKSKKAIGVCYDKSASADDTYEILVRLDQHEALDVAAVLAHELTHAAVGVDAGHGPRFGRVARALGLAGKLTATVPGERFKGAVAPLLDALGPFPHARLRWEGKRSGPKKQRARLLKVQCPTCGYVARVTSKWIEEVGTPLCPCTGEAMEVE